MTRKILFEIGKAKNSLGKQCFLQPFQDRGKNTFKIDILYICVNLYILYFLIGMTFTEKRISMEKLEYGH
jgi:hypothetical protein